MERRFAFEAAKLRALPIKNQKPKVYCKIIIYPHLKLLDLIIFRADDNNNVNNATNGKLLH